MHLLGYTIASAGLESCVSELTQWVRHGQYCKTAYCLNPHSYVLAKRLPEFHRALADARWLIPDGVGLLLGSYILYRRRPDRITGSDLFDALNGQMEVQGGVRVFFLGASEVTLAQIGKRFTLEFPRSTITGWHAPPYEDAMTNETFASCVSAINRARPDIVYVGLGAPKQELFLHRAKHQLATRVAVGVGSVFDFYAGTKPRAPGPLRRMGMEWVFRLFLEPRRMWKRTLLSAPVFMLDVLRGLWR